MHSRIRNSHNPLNIFFVDKKPTVPGTNIKLTKVEKPNKIWTDTWKKTLTESTLFGKMVEDSLKGVIRAAGWLQLDLILYGPRTVLNSFGFTNLFGRSSESTSRQFSDERAYKSIYYFKKQI